MRRIVFTLAIVTLASALLLALGTNNVSAPLPGTPAVYVNWDNTLNHVPAKAAGTLGSTQRAYIKTDLLPHDTTEPTASTDKTWLMEVKVRWDPTVLNLSAFYEPPVFAPGTPAIPGSVMKWNMWDPDFPDTPLGSYNTFWKVTYDYLADPSTCTVTYTLLDDPTLTALPTVDWNLSPDYGLHLGTKYDLPYTVKTGATNGKYVNMAELRWKVLNADAGAGSLIDLYDATFVSTGKIVYPVTPVDGTYGTVVVPEFPLGLGILMTIAAAIPVVYIWRTRPKRRV